MRPRVLLSLLLSLLFFAPSVGVSSAERTPPAADNAFSKEEKALMLNAAGIAGLFAYGYSIWQYGERDTPHWRWEGDFGAVTKHGGMDKLGHAFTGYAISRGFAGAYADWGFGEERAAWLGLGSSLFFTTMMEIGDSFSDFGLSPEDLVANVTGGVAGFCFTRYPALARFVDYRVEYWPSPNHPTKDVMTDYHHMKFHLVLKFDGFERLEGSWARFFELHLGYASTGEWYEQERNLFLGVGVNLARVFGDYPAAALFKYYQLPATYLKVGRLTRF